jgi:hypothetical protein
MKQQLWLSRSVVVGMLSAIPFVTQGCFVEVLDDDSSDESGFSSGRQNLPVQAAENSEACPSEGQNNPRYQSKEYASCFEEENYKWRVSCKSADCQAVQVYVHYMLTEDLGNANTVTVEAFDNNKFVGAPVSSVQISNYRASKAGDFDKTEIYLAPGSYFLRAFVANEDELLVPYSYQGLELISEKPVGVYGALSSPASIEVAPRRIEAHARPVHVTLDKLFKSQTEEPETKAYLRLSLSLEANAVVPTDRKLLVQLRNEADLGLAPVQEFTMLTESFLIEGRKGQAEFLSTSLPIGNYVVFAFIDANGNELYDQGELAALVQKNGEATKVAIKQNRTETIPLTLAADPKLPESVL